MALTTYYMLCLVNGDVIREARTADTFGVGPQYASVMEVRSATFSTDAGDSPDVLLAAPIPGYTFVAPGTHTAPPAAPADPYLKGEDWSGNGAADPDDGVWEMTSDGVNACTLTLKKWDMTTDTAITGAGDKFGVCILGSATCSTARITLDANGEATITITPGSTIKGEQDIICKPINVGYRAFKARVRFV